MMTAGEVNALKRALATDAAEAARSPSSLAWQEPDRWQKYMGPGRRKLLYRSLTDRELTAVLMEAAERLGRMPNKRDVFCVYRVFLIQRFGNWPNALVAAGLKLPKPERRAAQRQAIAESNRNRNMTKTEGTKG